MSRNSVMTLTLFSTETTFIAQAVAAGIQEILVDWESLGKEGRQAGADTQINHDTVEDLLRVRACTDALVLCRLNGFGRTTAMEIEQAIKAGADELLLPMVRSVEEVQAVLDQVRDRCRVGILIETVKATLLAEQLGRLPVSRVYVGLNDLAIERKTPNLFTALVDGTVERVRRAFSAPFGFGGLTLPDCGFPIPCRLLIAEMSRLGCSFGFLRRSFHRDIQRRDLRVETPRLHAAFCSAAQRSSADIERERRELEVAVQNWSRSLEFT